MLGGLGLVPGLAESILGTERHRGPGCGQGCSFSPGDAAQPRQGHGDQRPGHAQPAHSQM